MFSKNFCSNHPCCYMASAAFKKSNDLCLLFCLYPSSMLTVYPFYSLIPPLPLIVYSLASLPHPSSPTVLPLLYIYSTPSLPPPPSLPSQPLYFTPTLSPFQLFSHPLHTSVFHRHCLSFIYSNYSLLPFCPTSSLSTSKLKVY